MDQPEGPTLRENLGQRIQFSSFQAIYREIQESKLQLKLLYQTTPAYISLFHYSRPLLLAFEHVWHGEIVPWFPFLTAMNDPADTAKMLAEMGSIGVTMAAIITVVWGGMVLVTNSMEKRPCSLVQPFNKEVFS